MHLKNFSLIAFNKGHYQLAPAYDMVAVKLLIPKDQEELALNLNGKKRKLTRQDFNEALLKAHIPEKAVKNLWNRIEKGMHSWPTLIQNSFISEELKQTFIMHIQTRAEQLGLKFSVDT